RNELELLGREGLIVAVITESLDRAPGWHAPLQHFFLDGLSPGTALVVLHQRKSGPAGTMAGSATGIDDSQDFAVPRDLGGDHIVARGERGATENDTANFKNEVARSHRPGVFPVLILLPMRDRRATIAARR